MKEENKDLIVTNVEETPLSQGKTLTDLENEMLDVEETQKTLKTQMLIGYGLSGAVFLAGIIASAATNNGAFFLGGVFTSCFPGVIGAQAGKWLAYNRLFSGDYRKKYEELKQQLSNESTEENLGGKIR